MEKRHVFGFETPHGAPSHTTPAATATTAAATGKDDEKKVDQTGVTGTVGVTATT